MGELFKAVWTGATDTIQGITSAIKTAFMNLIYVDPTASAPVLSDFAKFSFMLIGFSLALSVVFMIVRKIKA